MKKQNLIMNATDRELFTQVAKLLGISIQECIERIAQKNIDSKLGLQDIKAALTVDSKNSFSTLFFDETETFDRNRKFFIDSLSKNDNETFILPSIVVKPSERTDENGKNPRNMQFTLSDNSGKRKITKAEQEMLIESLRGGSHNVPKELEFSPFLITESIGYNKSVLPNFHPTQDSTAKFGKVREAVGAIPMKMLEDKLNR